MLMRELLGNLERTNLLRKGKVSATLEDQYTRAYLWSLVHGGFGPYSCMAHDGKAGIFPRYRRSDGNESKIKEILDEMVDKKFLERDDCDEYFFSQEPIRTLVRYYSLSEEEASIVEDIYLNPEGWPLDENEYNRLVAI